MPISMGKNLLVVLGGQVFVYGFPCTVKRFPAKRNLRICPWGEEDQCVRALYGFYFKGPKKGKADRLSQPSMKVGGGKNGGESGIRTRGTPLKGVQSLSRRSLSATQPSLRDHSLVLCDPGRQVGFVSGGGSRIRTREPFGQRFSRPPP